MLALACAAGCSSATTGATTGSSASGPAAAGSTTGASAPAPSATASASGTPSTASPTPAAPPTPTPSATPTVEPATVVREAAAATGRTSARVDQSVRLTNGDTTYDLAVSGDFDLAADRGQLGVDLPGGAISHLDEIFADGQVYVRGSAGVPSGTWAAIDRDRTIAHALLRSPVNDPEHVLQQISTLGRVTRSGEEEVSGVRATRYDGMLTTDAVTLRLAPEIRSKLETYRSLSGSDLPIPAGVWVDPQGRVVKVQLTLDMSPIHSVTTVAFSELGKAVKVTAPPARNTTAVTELSGVLTG
ncbi:LppX_LprAFG lipoprotein [Kitasatospora sp. NPDC059327]|uniref:LppX_LprAFG lipoprotein n=1 Tax=Kitasatospora sp. NPDC059327 TaxID=3346803 RepID=UPI003695A406